MVKITYNAANQNGVAVTTLHEIAHCIVGVFKAEQARRRFVEQANILVVYLKIAPGDYLHPIGIGKIKVSTEDVKGMARLIAAA